ncbi:hypothetical protein AB0J09_57765, partial [Nonomuraea sp. NPDC049784]
MSEVTAERRFGQGPLSRAATLVYSLLVVEGMFLVASAPGLVALTLLGGDASNVPLAAACALPLGPALSAALYALRHRSRDLTDLHPAAAFWRGYKADANRSCDTHLHVFPLPSHWGVNLYLKDESV